MHKMVVVRILFCRADSLSSSNANINDEYTRIFNSLKTNHYPNSFIKRFSQKRPTTHEDKSYKKTVVLPYIRGVSEAIKRAMQSVDIRVVLNPSPLYGCI